MHCPLLGLHWKAPHETGLGVAHEPLPSQVGMGTRERSNETGVPLDVPVTAGAQVALPQVVPALANWHPPLPLHLPVLPQTSLVVVTQVVASRGGWPPPMLVQVPT